MDHDSPQTIEQGHLGEWDLGSHVVDQMIYLLGPVQTVDVQLDAVDLPELSVSRSPCVIPQVPTVTCRPANATF